MKYKLLSHEVQVVKSVKSRTDLVESKFSPQMVFSGARGDGWGEELKVSGEWGMGTGKGKGKQQRAILGRTNP